MAHALRGARPIEVAASGVVQAFAVFLQRHLAEAVDAAQGRAQVVRDRIGEGFQFAVGGGEIGGPFLDAAVEFAVELFDFEAGALLPGDVDEYPVKPPRLLVAPDIGHQAEHHEAARQSGRRVGPEVIHRLSRKDKLDMGLGEGEVSFADLPQMLADDGFLAETAVGGEVDVGESADPAVEGANPRRHVVHDELQVALVLGQCLQAFFQGVVSAAALSRQRFCSRTIAEATAVSTSSTRV